MNSSKLANNSMRQVNADIEDNHFPIIKCTAEIDAKFDDDEDNSAEQIISIESSGYFLVSFKAGTVKYVEDGLDNSTLNVAQFDKQVKFAYNQLFGSLIALNDQLVCARRESNGCYHMRTMLDEQQQKPSPTSGSKLSVPLRVEFNAAEYMMWKCFLATDDTVQKYAEIGKFAQKFEDFEEIKNKEDNNKMGPNLIIQIDDSKQFFHELASATAEDTSKQQSGGFHTFYCAHQLMERLRLALFPSDPYSLENSKQIQTTASHLMRSTTTSREGMNIEAARKLSFWRWPHNNFRNAIPLQMAQAGFFHQPNDGGEDRVLCFACNVCLVSWEPDDDPLQEHERHSAGCKFLTSPLLTSNIPLATTMANILPIRWNFGAQNGDGQNTEEQADIASSLPLLGSMTPNSIWIAFTSGNYAGDNSANPSITLVHLDKVVQIPYKLTVDLNDSFLVNAFGLSTTHQSTPSIDNCCAQQLPQAINQRRVTWRDESTNLNCVTGQQNAMDGANEDREKRPQQHQSQKQTSNCASNIAEITAICCTGVGPNSIAQRTPSTNQQHQYNPIQDFDPDIIELIEPTKTTISAVLFIGISIDETKIATTKPGAEEVNVLNAMNNISATTGDASTPRIVTTTVAMANPQEAPDEKEGNAAQICRRHPFVLVYHITESKRKENQSSQEICTNHADYKMAANVENYTNSPEIKLFEQCAIETDRLLAETKKLQEQTAALESELVDLLKVDYSVMKKGGNDTAESKEEKQEKEKGEETTLMQDNSVDFDTPIDEDAAATNNDEVDGGNGATAAVIPTFICGDQRQQQQQSNNGYQHQRVSIMYEPNETSSVVMQCFRLPEEFDSSDYRIDHIVATEQTNGYAILGVNRTDGQPGSALIVYSRMEVVNMLQESYVRKFHLQQGQLAQILLTPIDHFSMYHSKMETNHQNEGGRLNLAKAIQPMGSIILRFTSGNVVLFDLRSGLSAPIYEPPNGNAKLHATDVTLNQSTGQIMVLSRRGTIFGFDVKQPMPQHESNENDELIISEISKAIRSGEKAENIFTGQSMNPLFASMQNALNNTDYLARLWTMTRVEADPAVHLSQHGAGNSSSQRRMEPEDELKTTLIPNRTADIQVHAPMGWVDKYLQQQRKKRSISSIPMMSPSAEALNAASEMQSKAKRRTFWSFARAVGPIGTYMAGIREQQQQRLVFEFSIQSILSLSHMEITMEFPISLGDPNIAAVPIGELSVWLMGAEDADQLMRQHTLHAFTGFSFAHNEQTLLSLLGERPELLKQRGKCVYGPLKISQTSTAGVVSNLTRLQIGATPLILAAAAQKPATTTVMANGKQQQQMEREKATTNGDTNRGWLNQVHRFFVLFQPTTTLMRTTTAPAEGNTGCNLQPSMDTPTGSSATTSSTGTSTTTTILPPPKRSHIGGSIHPLSSSSTMAGSAAISANLLPRAFTVQLQYCASCPPPTATPKTSSIAP